MRAGLRDLVLLAIGVGLSAGGAYVTSRPPAAAAPVERGSDHVSDARGRSLPVRPYARIVSQTTIADDVLLALIDRRRIAAVTSRSSVGPRAHLFADLRALDASHLEEIVSLAPDLVIVSELGDVRRSARLAEAGIPVFDLGPPGGRDALVTAIRDLGRLVGEGPRGARLGAQLEARFDRVAASRACTGDALYLGAYGDRFFGAGPGSSYHDVLATAGFHDVSVPGFPSYTREALLTIDPPAIVVASDATLCTTLPELRACREHRIFGVDDALLSDPGFGMLEATEALAALCSPR